MSPRLNSIKPKEIINTLLKRGFVHKRTTGSHQIFRHPTTGKIAVVPVHGNKNIKIGTLRSILKQADISIDELLVPRPYED